MKKIFYILAAVLMTSCASISNLPKVDSATGHKIVYWSGNDLLLEIKDTTEGVRFEPVMLKHASKRQLRKLYPTQDESVSEAMYFLNQ